MTVTLLAFDSPIGAFSKPEVGSFSKFQNENPFQNQMVGKIWFLLELRVLVILTP